MPTASAYEITIDGEDVSSNFAPVLLEMTIEFTEGGKSDRLELKLDDTDGQIVLPRIGADIVALLYSLDDGSAVQFVGKTDEPKSSGARGAGMSLSITAHAADLLGEGKHKKHQHKDGGSFKDAATAFAPSGMSVMMDDDVGAVARDYWAMSNESFFSWGARLAQEVGAIFKVQGTTAIFASRNGTSSVSGQALAPLEVTWGDNLISWDMTPVVARAEYENAKVRWYDPKQAQWNEEAEPISDDPESGGAS